MAAEARKERVRSPEEWLAKIKELRNAGKHAEAEESLKALPPPGIHPLVRVHPENGRKALFLNPVRIESIIGMPDDEALDLVAELMTHATRKQYEYRHQ